MWIHRLSNIDKENKTADCANCGRVKVKSAHYGKSYRCYEAVKAAKYKNKKPLHSCEVCGSTKRICYDHDHATGEHRGWLCNACNVALGCVEDSPERLRALANYLER